MMPPFSVVALFWSIVDFLASSWLALALFVASVGYLLTLALLALVRFVVAFSAQRRIARYRKAFEPGYVVTPSQERGIYASVHRGKAGL